MIGAGKPVAAATAGLEGIVCRPDMLTAFTAAAAACACANDAMEATGCGANCIPPLGNEPEQQREKRKLSPTNRILFVQNEEKLVCDMMLVY